MSKKTVRERPWTPVTKQTKPYFTPEDVRKIFIKSRLWKPIPALKEDSSLNKIVEDLEEAALVYFTFKNITEGPKAADIKKSLARVQKTASAFHQCLKELDFRTKHEHLNLSPDQVELFEKTMHNAGFIGYSAKEAIKEINTKGGRPSSLSARINFIVRLAHVYETVTGKPAGVSRQAGQPSGPFFRLTKNLLAHIDPNPSLKDDALEKSIRKSLTRLFRYKRYISPNRA